MAPPKFPCDARGVDLDPFLRPDRPAGSAQHAGAQPSPGRPPGSIADTKKLVNAASLPSDAEIAPEFDASIASLHCPATQARSKKLMERGFHKPGDVANRLGYHVGSAR